LNNFPKEIFQNETDYCKKNLKAYKCFQKKQLKQYFFLIKNSEKKTKVDEE